MNVSELISKIFTIRVIIVFFSSAFGAASAAWVVVDWMLTHTTATINARMDSTEKKVNRDFDFINQTLASNKQSLSVDIKEINQRLSTLKETLSSLQSDLSSTTVSLKVLDERLQTSYAQTKANYHTLQTFHAFLKMLVKDDPDGQRFLDVLEILTPQTAMELIKDTQGMSEEAIVSHIQHRYNLPTDQAHIVYELLGALTNQSPQSPPTMSTDSAPKTEIAPISNFRIRQQ